MNKITVSIHPPQSNALNSLAELRKFKADAARLEKEQEQREVADQFKGRLDQWIDLVSQYDGGQDDHAAHRQGLVVLSDAQVATGNGSTTWYGNLSAELTMVPDHSGPAKAMIQIDDTEINYQRTANREVYQEVVDGQKTRLVLDHSRGTLTFTTP